MNKSDLLNMHMLHVELHSKKIKNGHVHRGRRLHSTTVICGEIEYDLIFYLNLNTMAKNRKIDGPGVSRLKMLG